MDRLNLYILTFNCARNVILTDRFASHLFDVLPQSVSTPELLLLSLQEIAPIAHAFLGGSFLDPYFDAFRSAVDLAVAKRWPNDDVKYVNIVTKNCGLTGMMVFVRSDRAGKVSWVETAEVGVGVQEMGNKGAVGVRLGYRQADHQGDTVDLTFVAAHLAPMEDAVDRRNQDWRGIVERLVFSKEGGKDGVDEIDEQDEAAALLQDSRGRQSGIFTPTSHLFFAGDLNYRTSDLGPTVDDLARFPQPTADSNRPTHHSQLLKYDQLTREIQAQRTLHGLSEVPITFAPTYKYSVQARLAAAEGTQDDELKEWKWATNRWPSWCDRILYLDLPPWMKDGDQIQPHGYDALPLFPTSDHRAVALAVSVPLKPLSPPATANPSDDIRLSPPFAIDREWRSKRAVARTKELLVGGLAYLGLTREGNGLLLAMTVGVTGGWFVLRSMFR
ncbi:hypothetical protein VTN77DRAFT_2986 [Rasamsonia byssochlamydoides]|uniref:uncharacterized protein n=1 Tax=Rasamsonia byssochlamydoides TaxID=89139 RepID=UPI003743DA76